MKLLCIGSIDINLHVYQLRPGVRLARGGGSPLPFIENCKKVIILEKTTLIVFIYGLNLSFKMF